MKRIAIFSWGYYGWGNAPEKFVQAVDAVERDQGFKPPLFVEVRIQRTGRAEGFKGSNFEKLLGPRLATRVDALDAPPWRCRRL